VSALRRSSGGRPVLDDALRAQARYRRAWRAGLAAATLLPGALAGLRAGPPGGAAATGAVTGYVQPCSGLLLPPGPAAGARPLSAAATVVALPGKEYLKPAGRGRYDTVFPAAVAARARVRQDQRFRLGGLSPGRYVILARYTGGNVITWLDVSVTAGGTDDVALPNGCM
jgi:hypothetical protein